MRTTPPPGGPVRNISYPEVPCSLLDNGIEVLCVSDHHLPRVSILVAIPSGSAHDPGPQGGLHRLSMEMLKEGTRELDSRRIAEVLDDHALDFSAEVRQEQTFLEMTGLERQLLPGLELLSALLREASFPEQELARVKQRWRSVLLSQRSDEGFLSGERLQADLFSDHPYSRVSFRPEHLDSITRDSMVQLLHHRLPTSETRVVFAGAVTPEAAVDMGGRFFAHWKPRSDRPGVSRPNQAGRPGRVSLVHRPNSAQVRIALGRRAVPVNHPDYLPLRLANQVLGGGGSARLFLNLREVRGYTYGVYSSLQGLEQDGVLSISAGVRTDAVVDSIEQVRVELERMSTAPPDEASRRRHRVPG
jgi:zinc protease